MEAQTYKIPYEDRVRKAKTVKNTHTTKTKDQTGKTTEEEQEVTWKFSKEDDYIKLYITDLVVLNDLPKGMAEFALTVIKRMSYDGTIALNASVKKIMLKELPSINSLAAFDNKLSKLAKSEILSRIDTGLYRINPFLFARGEWKDIIKQRETWIKIIYKDGKRIIETPQGTFNPKK